MPLVAALAVATVVQAGTPGQAGAQIPPSADELALAPPGLHVPAEGLLALPHPLSTADAERMRLAFVAQRDGRLADAIAWQATVEDKLLIPGLLADRYERWPNLVGPDALHDWLAANADLPDARAIRALLPGGTPADATPSLPTSPWGDADSEDAPELDPPGNQAADRAVRSRLRQGRPDLALAQLRRLHGVSASQMALLRGAVAQALFTSGDDAGAGSQAALAWGQGKGDVALPAFVAGLVAWRQEEPDSAAAWFELAARAPVASPAQHAAASYWAARAQSHRTAWRYWMSRAAADSRSFYGLLARRALGRGVGLRPDAETLSEADVEAVEDTSGGRRAFALLQVGEPARAAAELRLLWPRARLEPGFARALLLVARTAGLTTLAAQLAEQVRQQDGLPRDDTSFPMPPLAPRGGFIVDPALVYALVRVESNFDPAAVSGAGAHGLMQLMPTTAGVVTDELDADKPSPSKLSPGALREPAVSLQLGQRYLLYLARLDGIGGDLIRVLAGYNAGPGKLARWTQDAADDPLLFIEAIPSDETRRFVRRVLTASWIYAARLKLPARSLDDLAAGDWPGFDSGPHHPHIETARLN
jgi:soluble lytic murein transglycosylase